MSNFTVYQVIPITCIFLSSTTMLRILDLFKKEHHHLLLYLAPSLQKSPSTSICIDMQEHERQPEALTKRAIEAFPWAKYVPVRIAGRGNEGIAFYCLERAVAHSPPKSPAKNLKKMVVLKFAGSEDAREKLKIELQISEDIHTSPAPAHNPNVASRFLRVEEVSEGWVRMRATYPGLTLDTFMKRLGSIQFTTEERDQFTAHLFLQTVRAFRDLHVHYQVAHCDVVGNNVLFEGLLDYKKLTHFMDVVIIDFANAKKVEEPLETRDDVLNVCMRITDCVGVVKMEEIATGKEGKVKKWKAGAFRQHV